MSHALCVLNKRGGRKRTREKGGKPENNNNNMMEIRKSKPSIKTRLTIERWMDIVVMIKKEKGSCVPEHEISGLKVQRLGT